MHIATSEERIREAWPHLDERGGEAIEEVKDASRQLVGIGSADRKSVRDALLYARSQDMTAEQYIDYLKRQVGRAA